jgi:flagellar FliL protein
MAAKEKAKPEEETPEAEAPTEEAESGEGAGGDEEEGGGLNAKKIVLFVVLPLFLLAGAGGGLYFSGMLDKFLKKDGAATAEHGEESGGHGEAKGGHGGGGHGEGASDAFFLEIPNMLVNLSGTEGQPRYLRLKVQLELESAEDMHAVEAVMPRVVDQFQTYLRELRVKDLKGSAGMYRLQMELLSRVNAAAYPVEVKDVLFQEILIQ